MISLERSVRKLTMLSATTLRPSQLSGEGSAAGAVGSGSGMAII